MKAFSARSQKVIIWWGIVFVVIYGLALALLLDMVPPPNAHMTAVQVAHWYQVRHTRMEIGAVICAWTSAFMVPFSVVVAVQMWREEVGNKVWSVITVMSGGLMSIFLVLPPLFWGIAAFDPTRAPQVTDLMHEIGMLTLVTTDQFYIFMWVAVAAFCFIPKPDGVKHSIFTRWYGYFTAWTCVMFEAGAIAFLAHSGPFAWNGILVFWFPLTLFGIWIAVTCTLLLKSLNKQIADQEAGIVPADSLGMVAA